MHKVLVPYHDQDVLLEGFLTYQQPEKRPTVVLCHSWSGKDSLICGLAEQMALWGYTCFALDMYGQGVVGKTKAEKAALKQPFIQDRRLLQRRLLAALDTIQTLPYADPRSMAVVGFGFGGMCALDCARYVANLKGAVCVYGHFEAPPHLTASSMQAKILILHGHDDPVVPLKELSTLEEEMSAAQVDWQAHVYSKTVHAFTNPNANDPQFGIAYNPVSARRAWLSIRNFLQEVLGSNNDQLNPK